MGYMAHHAVNVVSSDADDRDALEAFRASLIGDHARLFVGPVRGAVNGEDMWTLLPDGSKEGWEDSDQGDRNRSALAAICRQRQIDFVEVRFGGDDWDVAYIVSHIGDSE